MSISVSDAMQLKNLQQLVLVAGKSGLHRMIDKIGILDHEIVEGIIGNFMTGDFVLTSFTAARNDKNKLEQCIKDLITSNISALAIKKIYYHKLSNYIIKLADKKGLPIFMFEEHVFFEDIIEDLMAGMQSRSHMELIASKIEILLKKDLKKPAILELAHELNRSFYPEHAGFYCREKKYGSDKNLLKIAQRYQRSRTRSIHHSVFRYNEGLMIVLTYKRITERDIVLDLQHIFNQLNIDKGDYFIGKSQLMHDLSQLNLCIQESIYASEAGELLNNSEQAYDDIGIYKVLLPYAKDKWLTQFAYKILEPIKGYDNAKLLETARVYIQNRGDIEKTAEQLYQHKNTIRYRLKKMKELIKVNDNAEFYEQLSIAVKSEKINTIYREEYR